jgi:hypothetical protein
VPFQNFVFRTEHFSYWELFSKYTEQQENGEWKYSVEHCVNGFGYTISLIFRLDLAKVAQQIYKCVARFRNVGTVASKSQ